MSSELGGLLKPPNSKLGSSSKQTVVSTQSVILSERLGQCKPSSACSKFLTPGSVRHQMDMKGAKSTGVVFSTPEKNLVMILFNK